MPTVRGTWSFQLFGIPVQVQPFFWLIALLFSPFLSFGGGAEDPRVSLLGLLAWAAAWFLSFMIHEMGHALAVSRIFGGAPRIVLYGFGGETVYQPYYTRKPGHFGSAFISFAGPGASVAAVLLLIGVLALCGISFSFGFDQFGPIRVPMVSADLVRYWQPRSELTCLTWFTLYLFVNSFIWMGLFWSVLNLLPIYPLDGGHIVRTLAQKWLPRNGVQVSLYISIITVFCLIGYCFAERRFFVAVFFGLFAHLNWQELKRFG